MSTERIPSHTDLENDLHRFVDDELDEGQRQRVDDYLAKRPGEADRVEEFRRHKELFEMLRNGFEPIDNGGAIGELQRELRKSLRRQRRKVHVLRYAASVAVFLAVGASGLWFSSQGPATDVASDASAPVPNLTFGGMMVRGNSEALIDEGEESIAWLAQHLVDRPLSVPRLEDHGLQLVGGAVLHSAQVPAIRLAYLDLNSRPYFLYVGLAAEPQYQAFPFVPEGYLSINWRRKGLLLALTGPIESQELLAIMRSISDNMVKVPAAPSEGSTTNPDKLSPTPGNSALQSVQMLEPAPEGSDATGLPKSAAEPNSSPELVSPLQIPVISESQGKAEPL